MVVRVTFLFNKRADMSYDAFNAYWSETHAQVFSSLEVVKQRLVKYSQFHFDRKAAEEMRVLGVPIGEYDGAAEFWANSFEDINAVFTDAEYLKTVVPDERRFLDRESARVFVGHDEVKHGGDATAA